MSSESESLNLDNRTEVTKVLQWIEKVCDFGIQAVNSVVAFYS